MQDQRYASSKCGNQGCGCHGHSHDISIVNTDKKVPYSKADTNDTAAMSLYSSISPKLLVPLFFLKSFDGSSNFFNTLFQKLLPMKKNNPYEHSVLPAFVYLLCAVISGFDTQVHVTGYKNTLLKQSGQQTSRCFSIMCMIGCNLELVTTPISVATLLSYIYKKNPLWDYDGAISTGVTWGLSCFTFLWVLLTSDVAYQFAKRMQAKPQEEQSLLDDTKGSSSDVKDMQSEAVATHSSASSQTLSHLQAKSKEGQPLLNAADMLSHDVKDMQSEAVANHTSASSQTLSHLKIAGRAILMGVGEGVDATNLIVSITRMCYNDRDNEVLNSVFLGVFTLFSGLKVVAGKNRLAQFFPGANAINYSEFARSSIALVSTLLDIVGLTSSPFALNTFLLEGNIMQESQLSTWVFSGLTVLFFLLSLGAAKIIFTFNEESLTSGALCCSDC